MLLAKVGETEYPELPIIVVEQTKTQVRFKVKNTWSNVVSRIFTQYHAGVTGDNECFETDNIQRGESNEFTAYCMHNVPITLVDVWVSDVSFNATSDNADVPICCHPPSDDTNPKVHYSFKVYCVSQCVSSTSAPESRRRLDSFSVEEDAQQPEKNQEVGTLESTDAEGSGSGHYCSNNDYPCGDDDSMVYVCHYSAKRGYQTFCVNEPDTDIIAYYPKDYCGPCVGGYGTKGDQELKRSLRK